MATREKIEEHIAKAGSVQSAATVEIAAPAYRSWDKRVSIFLDKAFQKDGGWLDSTPKDEFNSAVGLTYPFGLELSDDVSLEGIRRDVDTKVERLNHLLSVVDEYEFVDGVSDFGRADGLAPGAEIFILHGRDDKTRMKLELLILRRTGKSAIALSDQPNRGATVIEKFESAFNPASFAIAAMSSDDRGGLATTDETQLRARQNVILALGYAMANWGVAERQYCTTLQLNCPVTSGVSHTTRSTSWGSGSRAYSASSKVLGLTSSLTRSACVVDCLVKCALRAPLASIDRWKSARAGNAIVGVMMSPLPTTV